MSINDRWDALVELGGDFSGASRVALSATARFFQARSDRDKTCLRGVFPRKLPPLKGRSMQKLFEKFQRVIVLTLMAFMMLAVLLATIEVGVILWQQMMKPPLMLLDVKEMMEVFGFILMVIIGLELLETIKAYLTKHEIHVEVVLLVALVAVARKVIILDYKDIEPEMMFAVAALVLSMSTGFFLVRRALSEKRKIGTNEPEA